MRINNDNIFTNQVVSGVGNYSSDNIWLGHIYGYSIQALVQASGSSGLSGTLKLEASNDFTHPQNPMITNWTEVADSSTSVAITGVSGTTDIMWNVTDVFYSWARVNYTGTSGVGVINARVNVKGV